MESVIQIIILLIAIDFVVHLTTDYVKITRDITVNHEPYIVVFLFFGLLYFDSIGLTLLAMSLYLSGFNVALNKLRGLDYNYLGKKAVTDRVLRYLRIKPTIQYIIYIALSLIIYVYEKIDK